MHIAIVGATGSLGHDIIDNLSQLDRKNITLSAFATENSIAETISFAESTIQVKQATQDSFKMLILLCLLYQLKLLKNTQKWQ